MCVDAVTPVVGGIGLVAGEVKIVTAAELGDISANKFFNCTNGSVSDAGSLKVKVM